MPWGISRYICISNLRVNPHDWLGHPGFSMLCTENRPWMWNAVDISSKTTHQMVLMTMDFAVPPSHLALFQRHEGAELIHPLYHQLSNSSGDSLSSSLHTRGLSTTETGSHPGHSNIADTGDLYTSSHSPYRGVNAFTPMDDGGEFLMLLLHD